MSKEHHQSDLSKLRLDYGRDLAALHKSHLRKEEELRESMEIEYQERVAQIHAEHELYIEELNLAFENDQENIRKDLERSEIMRLEMDREIKKLKKKSNGAAHGGWGTFALVFEDNPKKHHPLVPIGAAQTVTSGA